MNIKFTDRFNRKFLHCNSDYKENIVGYEQSGRTYAFNRDTLPSGFWLDGDIVWVNTKIKWHCITGPSISMIKGEFVYQINDKEMSKLEWLLKNEY